MFERYKYHFTTIVKYFWWQIVSKILEIDLRDYRLHMICCCLCISIRARQRSSSTQNLSVISDQ